MANSFLAEIFRLPDYVLSLDEAAHVVRAIPSNVPPGRTDITAQYTVMIGHAGHTRNTGGKVHLAELTLWKNGKPTIGPAFCQAGGNIRGGLRGSLVTDRDFSAVTCQRCAGIVSAEQRNAKAVTVNADTFHRLHEDYVGGQTSNCAYEDWDELSEDAEYQGHSVTLNKPFRSNDGKHKFYVYVKNDKNNVIKLGFGDPNLSIKRDDPDRRKNYRARHGCDDPGPKWKANWWSCKFWSRQNVSDLV